MNMTPEVLERLQNAGLLAEQELDLGNVPTGTYALNKIISGDYHIGIPIGMMTQIHGESSTAKTIFVTHILIEAQKKGYITVLVDSENAYRTAFAVKLGIDSEKLVYKTPEYVEDCFNFMATFIKSIREVDKDTPIVIGYDSIAVSPSKSEHEAEDYNGNNMVGANRAKATGACLRKINPLLRREKVALVIVNQIRSKVGVMFGSPDTAAGGGKSLDYYLGVNIKTLSAKSDRILDKHKRSIGIRGKCRNIKNKVATPHQECEFELLFDKGLNPLYGLLHQLVLDDHVTQQGAWYAYKDMKFQNKTFMDGFLTEDKFAELREIVGL
jgi:recombination protein RecA